MTTGLILNIIFLILVVKYVTDIALVVWCNAVYGVPYVPTDSKLIAETVKKVKMDRGQKIIELGSGDGRVLVEFAKKYQIEGVGYEKNRLLLAISRLRARLAWWKKGEVKFVDGDLFKVPLKGVDVVYIYLLPWMIEKLRSKFESELVKGSRIVSFDYPLVSDQFEVEEMVGRGKQRVAIYKKLR